MVKSSDIQLFYEKYMYNIEHGLNMQKELMDFSCTKEQWKRRLKENSIEYRNMYLENENLIKNIIMPYATEEMKLDDETAQVFLKSMELFMRTDINDSLVTADILELLIEYYMSEHNMYGYLKSCYYKAIYQQRYVLTDNYYMALEYFSKVTDYKTEFFHAPDDIKEIIIYSFVNRIYCASMIITRENSHDSGMIFTYLKEAEEFYNNSQVRSECDLEYDFERMIKQARTAVVTAGTRMEGRDNLECAYEAAGRLYNDELDKGCVNGKIYADYMLLKYKTGRVSAEDFFSEIYRYYVKKRRAAGDDALYIRELLINNAPMVVRYADLPDISVNEKRDMRTDILNDFVEYFKNQEIRRNSVFVNETIWNILDIALRNVSEKEFVRKTILDLTVFRNINTAIHSVMCSKIALAIAKKAVNAAPEIFADGHAYDDMQDVMMHREDIYHFVRDAALLHDVGKILCTEQINYNRKITEDEFQMIKEHPLNGARLLNRISALKEYSDICMYHHKYYDGTHGYPEGADNTRSEIKIYVDLITIADTIDSASDNIGRSYAKGKSFSTVLNELKEGKNTRYNGEIVELIEDNRDLQEELKNITGSEREDVYYQIYKKFSEDNKET